MSVLTMPTTAKGMHRYTSMPLDEGACSYYHQLPHNRLPGADISSLIPIAVCI